MNQSNAEAEVMLEAVVRVARAEYARRDRAELSSDVFAELDSAELEALASQVLKRLRQTSASRNGRSRGRFLRPGLVGLAALAAGVFSLGLWWQVGSLEPVPARITQEPVAPPARSTPAVPELPVGIAEQDSSWLPDAAGWLCTDSAFVDTGRSEAEPSDPERAPLLWLEVRPGYGDADATLLNRMDATPFRGQRLRLQARLEVADVTGSAGLWLRVDGAGQRTLVRSSRGNGLSGTHDFELREVTVDVPPDGKAIVFGASLSGTGQLSIKDVLLALVSRSTPASGATANQEDPSAVAPPVLGGPRKRPLRPVP
jgi:hypothetical protein